MCVTARRRPARSLREGFSLLEVVIAAGLVMATVTVVTATVVNASRAGSRIDSSMTVDRVLRREVERLRALPYCAPSYPTMSQPHWAEGCSAEDLVGAVFPHAVASANRESARYVIVGATAEQPAGSFVTCEEVDGLSLTRVARFLAAEGSEPLGPDASAGWAVWCASPPPAAALEVRVNVVEGDVRREGRIVHAALPPVTSELGASGSGG